MIVTIYLDQEIIDPIKGKYFSVSGGKFCTKNQILLFLAKSIHSVYDYKHKVYF